MSLNFHIFNNQKELKKKLNKNLISEQHPFNFNILEPRVWSLGIKAFYFLTFILIVFFIFILFNNLIDCLNNRSIVLSLDNSVTAIPKKYLNIFMSKAKTILKNKYVWFLFEIIICLVIRVIIKLFFNHIFKNYIFTDSGFKKATNDVSPFSLNENVFNNVYETNGLPFIPIKFNYSAIDRYSTQFDKFNQLDSSVQIEEITDIILKIDVL